MANECTSITELIKVITEQKEPTISNVNIDVLELTNERLIDVTFVNCTFKSCIFNDVSFERTKFINCKIKSLEIVSKTDTKILRSGQYYGVQDLSKIDCIQIVRTEIGKLTVSEAVLYGAVLNNCIISEFKVARATLAGVRITKTAVSRFFIDTTEFYDLFLSKSKVGKLHIRNSIFKASLIKHLKVEEESQMTKSMFLVCSLGELKILATIEVKGCIFDTTDVFEDSINLPSRSYQSIKEKASIDDKTKYYCHRLRFVDKETSSNNKFLKMSKKTR